MNIKNPCLEDTLLQVVHQLRLTSASLFRIENDEALELAASGTFPAGQQTTEERLRIIRSGPILSVENLPTKVGTFVVRVATIGTFNCILLTNRAIESAGLFRRIDPLSVKVLYQRVLENEVRLLAAQTNRLRTERQLVSTSTNALLQHYDTNTEIPSYEITLEYLRRLFSLDHGNIWELHDDAYLTLEAVSNSDLRKYKLNCLPKDKGLVWRALRPNAPKVQEFNKTLRREDLANADLFELYCDRHVYLIRLGEYPHPYGVACLAGSEPTAPNDNLSILHTFEQLLALELRSRRRDLTSRVFSSLQNLFTHAEQDIPGICNTISKQLLSIIGCQAVSVVTKLGLDPSSPKMVVVASQIAPGLKPSEDLVQFSGGEEFIYAVNARSLTGLVAFTEKPIIDNAVSTNEKNSFRYREQADRSNDTWIGVPILTASKHCIGVLRCSGKLTEIHGAPFNYIFDSLDQQLLTNAASILAPLLQHNQLTHDLMMINERLQADERIRAHEMRGPLQLIHSQAEFVLQRLEDRAASSRPRRLGTILTNVDLCSTLLTSTTLPAPQQFRSELQEVDLGKLLKGLVEVLKHQIEARSPSQITEDPITHELVLTAQPFMIVELHGSCPILIGHRNLLQRAFYNIANNAVKYAKRTEKGRLEIRIDQTTDGNKARIHFVDHGIGVADDEVAKIFEGRFRGRERNKRPGEGLGLKIAKAIIEQHEGSLALLKLAAPTIFEILLPFNRGNQ